MKQWLTEKVKLPQYLTVFEDNGFDNLDIVGEHITNIDMLSGIGIGKIGHRLMLFKEIKKLRNQQLITQDLLSISNPSASQNQNS